MASFQGHLNQSIVLNRGAPVEVSVPWLIERGNCLSVRVPREGRNRQLWIQDTQLERSTWGFALTNSW
jgi:hypothetical protein